LRRRLAGSFLSFPSLFFALQRDPGPQAGQAASLVPFGQDPASHPEEQAMSDELPTAARVSDPGIRALYRLENRWQAWLDVEAALAKLRAEPEDPEQRIAVTLLGVKQSVSMMLFAQRSLRLAS
jgi:hypothetical protein